MVKIQATNKQYALKIPKRRNAFPRRGFISLKNKTEFNPVKDISYELQSELIGILVV